MRTCIRFALVVGGLLGALTTSGFVGSSSAQAATLKAVVDISEQRMRVYVNGKQKYRWPVSTGTKKYPTRTGTFTPFYRTPKVYSKKWNMTLTYVVDFDQKSESINAIHGTNAVSKLGRRASHGCVRLSNRNAAKFYKLVGQHGLWSTQVVVKR